MYVCISSYVGGYLVAMGMLMLLAVYMVHLAVILIWRFGDFGFDHQI